MSLVQGLKLEDLQRKMNDEEFTEDQVKSNQQNLEHLENDARIPEVVALVNHFQEVTENYSKIEFKIRNRPKNFIIVKPEDQESMQVFFDSCISEIADLSSTLREIEDLGVIEPVLTSDIDARICQEFLKISSNEDESNQ